jgi:hypothetical protein
MWQLLSLLSSRDVNYAACCAQVAGGCLQAFAGSVTTSGTKVLGTWAYMIMFGVLQIALAMVSSSHITDWALKPALAVALHGPT